MWKCCSEHKLIMSDAWSVNHFSYAVKALMHSEYYSESDCFTWSVVVTMIQASICSCICNGMKCHFSNVRNIFRIHRQCEILPSIVRTICMITRILKWHSWNVFFSNTVWRHMIKTCNFCDFAMQTQNILFFLFLQNIRKRNQNSYNYE